MCVLCIAFAGVKLHGLMGWMSNGKRIKCEGETSTGRESTNKDKNKVIFGVDTSVEREGKKMKKTFGGRNHAFFSKGEQMRATAMYEAAE